MDLAHREMFRANVGKGGISVVGRTFSAFDSHYDGIVANSHQ